MKRYYVTVKEENDFEAEFQVGYEITDEMANKPPLVLSFHLLFRAIESTLDHMPKKTARTYTETLKLAALQRAGDINIDTRKVAEER